MLLKLPLTCETECIYIGRLIIHPIITFFFSCFASIVTIIGGIVFLAFAFSALFIKPDAGF